ncbi:DUF3027 domain-containing protein [Pseudoclavibacter sp. 13-3]|uniref:DUF3027 domain-containing protein n=1 Tax=Pseudoclavibacter sp. 13-3 TaxID=2901228 RepID=UPI001E425B30|nr:DUF3027 domain-containing protein [Pseudoclavibacter sp. 13-3]MCD7101781.1 DUF3027 domain-containing protein [Pseudoclavibacter sp. 13-3]
MSDPTVSDPAAFLAQEAAARSALAEIAPARQIGALLRADPEPDENVFTLRFASDVPGYPHWEWAAVLGRVDAVSTPTVLEVGLMPGAGALVPPAWVPWSERFAEYKAQHDDDSDEDSTADAESQSDGDAESEAADEPMSEETAETTAEAEGSPSEE